MNAMNVTDTSKRLNLSEIRVRGLLKEGKLVRVKAFKVTSKGRQEVTYITVESIEKYESWKKDVIAQVQARKEEKESKVKSPKKDTKQYIVELTPEQVQKLQEMGYEIKPRFVYTPKTQDESEPEIVFE